MSQQTENRAGIIAIVIGMTLITMNDTLVKSLSGSYALHQIMLVRGLIGFGLLAALVGVMGGPRILRTRRPGMHALRASMVVISNLTFFTALAAMPLAQVTALFFIAPLLITLMSIVFLGMRVGPHRILALCVGFVGVLVMLGPELWRPAGAGAAVFLPLLAALSYSVLQILTRKLGPEAHPAAMSIYIQAAFILVSAGFYLVAGDGRFASAASHPSFEFLLRAWVWPLAGDLWRFGLIGVLIAGISWFMTQAYRLAEPASVAPFEYVAMPLAALWGFLFFEETPGPSIWIGMTLVAGSGLYVVWRERKSQTVENMG